MVDFEDIKRLAPEKRVEALKAVIGKLQAEIKESHKEIEQASHMLVLAEDESRVLEEVSIPESITEKVESKKPEERPQELEALLATAPRTEEAIHHVAHAPMDEIYSEIQTINSRQAQTGVETEDDRNRIYALQRGIETKKKDMDRGVYSAGNDAQHMMSAAQEMLQGMYKERGQDYKSNP